MGGGYFCFGDGLGLGELDRPSGRIDRARGNSDERSILAMQEVRRTHGTCFSGKRQRMRMKNLFVLIVAIVSLTLVSGSTRWEGKSALSGMTASMETATARDPEDCPYRTREEWQEFLRQYAGDERWVKTCEDSVCDAKFYERIGINVQGVFDRCGKFLAKDDAVAKCTRHMRIFTPVWMRQHDDSSYGFAVDNEAYFAAQEAPDKPPGMMKIPGIIEAALPDRKKVEEAARKAGLKYLTHDSALEGFRTFIFNPDPAGRFDQWMLLNLQSGEEKVRPDAPLSILTVQKKDAAGQVLPRVKLHFRDYTIVPLPETGRFQLHLHVENNGKCYACHSNGVRQLIAGRTPITEALPVQGEAADGDLKDFGYRRLQEFNRKLRSYGSPDWDWMIIQKDNGPMLGKAQGCMDCHNGVSRNPLWVLTSMAQVKQKEVNELSMPPDPRVSRLLERQQMGNPPLDRDEEERLKKSHQAREARYEDFERARLPTLRQWFLETPCL